MVIFDGSLGEQVSAFRFVLLSKWRHPVFNWRVWIQRTHNQFITFPTLPLLIVKQTVLALLNGTDPVASFYQLCDDRMAIFDAEMDFNGDEFFLLNGKFAYKLKPFAENAQYIEETYNEEVRTFKVTKDGTEWQLNNFQTWYDLEALQERYGTLLPEGLEKKLQKTQRSENLNQWY